MPKKLSAKIQYAVTYEIVTEESAQCGDAEERGFLADHDNPCESSFSELVDLMGGWEPSSSPPDEQSWYTLYQSNDGTREFYETDRVENQSYHPITERDGRYMLKAWRAANS